MYGECTSPEEERIATAIVEAAYRVHSRMGPGLLESVYEACMTHELHKLGFNVQRQLPVPIIYDGVALDEGFRLDLLVNGLVVVEIKAVEKTTTVHFLQVKTHIRLMALRLGFLINFNVPRIKDGIRRVIVTSVPVS